MAWWLIDSEADPFYDKEMLGNARGMELMRDGHEAIITSDTIGYPKSTIIPSDTTVKGFGREKDGKSLYELTDSGVICNAALLPRQ